MENTRQAVAKPNWFQRNYATHVANQNKRLLARILASPDLRPLRTPDMIAGIGLSVFVHLFTLLILIVGLWLLIQTVQAFNLFGLIGGLLCIGIVWVVRPTLGRWPKSDVLPRETFPALYGVADQVAVALRLPPIDGIVIDDQANAAFSKMGLRRRTVLIIGLPLWAILDDQEQVGLIAHELAHYFNDDVTRTWLAGAALTALSKWYELLIPYKTVRSVRVRRAGRRSYTRVSFGQETAGAEMLSRAVMRLLAQIPLAVLFVERYLFIQNSKYSEYLADRVAASVAGREAVISTMGRLQMTDALTFILNRVRTTGKRDSNVIDLFRERVRTITPADLKRLNEQETEMTENMMSHPPYSFRLEALHAYSAPEPKVTISAEQHEQLQAELAPFYPKIQAKLLADQ